MKKFLLGIFIFMAVSIESHASLTFIPPTDPRLAQTCKVVPQEEISSEKIQNLIHQMLLLCGYEADTSKTNKSSVLVGLAAPQIGEMHQIIILNTSNDYRNIERAAFEVLINPVIIWQSEEKIQNHEGCFSVPNCYIGAPYRPQAVVVEAFNPKGEKVTKRYENFQAQIVSHEIDHLHGIRFPERLNCEQELHIVSEATNWAEYKKNWKNWDHCASFDKWQQLRNKNYNE